MKTGILIGLMMAALSTSGAWAESDQQTRMKTCNADAKKQSLAGDARKTFMKTCLSNSDAKLAPAKAATPAVAATPASPSKESDKAEKEVDKADKPLTKQQQRMKDCNAEAKAKELKGDPRKVFMKSCLSNKK